MYPHYSDLTWRIQAPSGKIIIMVFDKFSTDSSGDYLQIEDGQNLLGNYSGHWTNIMLISQTNMVNLKFISLSYYADTGFTINYTMSDTGESN